MASIVLHNAALRALGQELNWALSFRQLSPAGPVEASVTEAAVTIVGLPARDGTEAIWKLIDAIRRAKEKLAAKGTQASDEALARTANDIVRHDFQTAGVCYRWAFPRTGTPQFVRDAFDEEPGAPR